MKIELDPNQGYVKDKKFNQYEALQSVGVKAAVCFKNQTGSELISPNKIREEESAATLINRAISTIISDHTSPSEQQVISLEITGIPKKICMILNNEHEYAADERSLRYTAVEESDLITKKQVELYHKWLKIFNELITKDYFDFYRRFNKSDASTKSAILKIAQENARYMVSVDIPTTITYTVPLAQINKLAIYMNQVVLNPQNDFELGLVPYFKDMITQLKDLKVLITKDDIYQLSKINPELQEKLTKTIPNINEFCNDYSLIYQNNKDIELSLLANRNKFSTINKPNFVNASSISFSNYESYACLAQEQRHRTIDCEMLVPEKIMPYIPEILVSHPNLVKEWITDMTSVAMYQPQGARVKVNRQATLKNLFNFVAKERACDRAQLEIERVYTKEIIPYIYQELLSSNDEETALIVKSYLNNLRCAFKDYKCPSPCGHPRLERKL